MKASDVVPKPIDWLWYPYIPLGKLTLGAGKPGQAKTLLTNWLTAAVTTTANVDLTSAGSVIMLNAEDDPADTIRPRLEAAGADLERVWIEPAVNLDVANLRRLCDEAGDVRLITIDPIAAYLGSTVNSWKAQDVRAALEPLRKLSAERALSVFMVQHLNRRGDSGDALDRIADSQGIAQLARSVLIWGADPADPDGDAGVTKALTRAKSNLAKASASATFEIAVKTVSANIQAPYLIRGTDRAIGADEVVSDRETRTALEEAAEFLKARLADGPVEAKKITTEANGAGIATKTLQRAKTRLHVKSEQTREGDLISRWMWSLSTHIPNDHLDYVGHLGQLDKVVKKAKEPNTATTYEPLNALTADVA